MMIRRNERQSHLRDFIVSARCPKDRSRSIRKFLARRRAEDPTNGIFSGLHE
jgi:hypothetical protein